MEYYLKCMDPTDTERIYEAMKLDFPEDELKPLDWFKRIVEEGKEVVWLLIADGREVGYASMSVNPAARFVLLDYLAMYEKDKGHGTACLALLKNEYPQGMLVEAEALDPIDAEVNEIRSRRFRFYRRSGFVPYEFPASVFGVEFLVHLWCLEHLEHPAHDAALALDIIYAMQMPDQLYRDNIFIEIPEL